MDNTLLLKLTETWFSLQTPTLTEIKDTGVNRTFQAMNRIIVEDDSMRVFLFPAGKMNDGTSEIWGKLHNDKRAREGVDPDKLTFFTVFATGGTVEADDADRVIAFAFKKIFHKDGMGYPKIDAVQRFITEPFIPLFQQLTFQELRQIGYDISHIQTEIDTYVQKEPHVENLFLHNDFLDAPGLRLVTTFSSCELTQSLLKLREIAPPTKSYAEWKDAPVFFIVEPMLETFFGSIVVVINLDALKEAAKKDNRYVSFLPILTTTFEHFGIAMIQQIIRKAACDFVKDALDEKPTLGPWIQMSPVIMPSITRYRNPHFISTMAI